MNIIDILVEEQVVSNAIFGAILKNSGLIDDPNKEQLKPKITNLVNRFRQLKNLNPELPQVKTFLYHYDGVHAKPQFKGDIKSVTNYTLKQLEFLISEYSTDDAANTDTQDRELLTKTQYNDETAELSKKLWYSDENAIINLPGFRVYQPKSQADAIKYGWYEQKLMNEMRPGHHAWCVTWRTGSNRWEYYRSKGGTFFFIIDESKLQSEDPETRKFYLGALQVIDKNKNAYHPGYEMTDIFNRGEHEENWAQVTATYPQLAEYKESLQPIEFSQEEVEMRDNVSSINETPGSPKAFWRQPRQYKKEYINLKLKISTPESWYSMDNELRDLYIVLSERGEFHYRFSNFELLRAVRKTGKSKLLNDEMIKKEQNEGVKSLAMSLMSELKPVEERIGIVNENIILYKTRKNRYGLWNNNTDDWLELHGNNYEPSYTLINEEIVENPKTKERFYVDKFESNEGDYFIAATPIDDIDSYFLSKQAWETIKDKFTSEGSEQMLSKSQDINEIKKGQ
jgi:hypothetical protein